MKTQKVIFLYVSAIRCYYYTYVWNKYIVFDEVKRKKERKKKTGEKRRLTSKTRRLDYYILKR